MTGILESQLDRLRRGAEAIYAEPELKEKLDSGRQLRIKYGMDPTAPDIHLGHTVQLRLLRWFQDLGHRVVLIIGDYTAMIGDPSGRDTTRPMLDLDTINDNARTYLAQAGTILDTSPDKLETRRNSEWLQPLSYADVLRITGMATVQQMIARENFRQRLDAGREIVITELLYPLMQGYDSIVIEADVEFGGSDQTFNCLLGRDMQAKVGLDRQVVIITPLLVGLDGHEKMSKSKGNCVGVTDRPDAMFGKVMSIPDELMGHYFRLLTPLPEARIASLIDPETTHPREAKDTLAQALVEAFCGSAAAHAASVEFKRRFAEHALPSDVETKTVDADRLSVVKLMGEVEFASSNSQARRLITQGAVTWNDRKITDPKAEVDIPADRADPAVLRVGKRRVCRIARA